MCYCVAAIVFVKAKKIILVQGFILGCGGICPFLEIVSPLDINI